MTTASDAGDGWRTEDTYYCQSAEDQPLSEAVVRAVEAVSDRSSVAGDDAARPLDPLYERIDPDALDALFHGRGDGPGSRAGEVTFAYCGYEVTVESTGLVAVTER